MEKISDDKMLWRNTAREKKNLTELNTQIDLMTKRKKVCECVVLRAVRSPSLTLPFHVSIHLYFISLYTRPRVPFATSNLFIASPVPTLEIK